MATISGGIVPRWAAAVCAGILVVAFSAMLWFGSTARAAEVVYWDNYSDDTVAFAGIDGNGGGLLNLAGVTIDSPEGMAYDSVTNRLFVASSSGGPGGNGEIVFVNLDGSGAGVLNTAGAPVDAPEAIAVDPVTRIVYWANVEGTADSIGWARLDGSGGGSLNTSGAPVEEIYKLAIDPVGGRVYWTNEPASGPQFISFANANNTGGGGTLSLAGATPPEGITGLSVDPAGNRIYWLDQSGERVSFASLSGGSGGDVNLAGSVFKDPYGLAFDPSIGRFYWANYNSATKEQAAAIGFVNLAGGGGAINIATAPVHGPQDPVILKSPSGTGVPTVTRSTTSRASLSCSTGSWGADYAGSFVYQAPRAFAYQWTRNGTPIAGATATTFNAKSVGQYACSVTATNQTGSAAQTSAAVKVNSAKVKLAVKKKIVVKAGGVAKFKVKGVNQGDIQSKKARVCVKLPKSAKGILKAPKCATLGKLKGRGKHGSILKVKVGKTATGTYKVTFSVHGSAGKAAKSKIVVVAPKK
jgi:DNA-binding beta-propeller fold protein YncE